MLKRQIDTITKKPKLIIPSRELKTITYLPKPNPVWRFLFGRFVLPSLMFAGGLVVAASIQLSAFEAHVLNVTAVIDREPNQCFGGQPKFWQDTAGCAGGKGENIWTSQVNVLSDNFSGFFAEISGNEICVLFDNFSQRSCPAVETAEGARCYAEAHALANELNLVSGRLDPKALLAGADMGNEAFDHLGLNSYSTIEEALGEVEEILAFPESTATELLAAAVVSKAIHLFYEESNPQTPQCIFEESDWSGVESLSAPVDPNYLLEGIVQDIQEENGATIETTEEEIKEEEKVIEVVEEVVNEEAPTEVIETEVVEEASGEVGEEIAPEPEPEEEVISEPPEEEAIVKTEEVEETGEAEETEETTEPETPVAETPPAEPEPEPEPDQPPVEEPEPEPEANQTTDESAV